MANSAFNTVASKLRLAMIGGGPGSFIGPIHRSAALMFNRYEIVAAVLSSDPERSRSAAAGLGVDRGYGDAFELIARESQRDDGAQVVAILTPNDSHAALAAAAMEAGLAVMCEKPLGIDLPSAYRLEALQLQRNALFAISMSYSAYPMVRQARAMVAEGMLGEIRMLQGQYIQGHLAAPKPRTGQGKHFWHLDEKKVGPSLILGDIGTHVFHLLHFVSRQIPAEISADVCNLVPENAVEDYAAVLMRYSNGARASLQITQAAAGGVHGLSFAIYGEKGGLLWHQEQPNELIFRPHNGPIQTLCRGANYLHPAAHIASRVALGHPEGYRETFATIYLEFSEAFAAHQENRTPPPFLWYPTLSDGILGMRFIDAGVRSREAGGGWVEF